MVAFCLEVTAPKSVSLPTGPSELHRNPICCHWARTDRTETRFAASTAGAPDVFPDVELRSMAEFLPVPTGRPPPLELQRLRGPPIPVPLDVGTSLRDYSSNAVPAHPPPRNPSRLALSGPRRRSPARRSPRRIAPRVVGVADPAGHGRRGWPRTPAPGHRPCTRPTAVGYDRWPVGREVHRPDEAPGRPPTSKTVHIPMTQVQPRASPK